MPQIKVQNVITFSSEDHVHVATNLLSQDPTKKWKCKTTGEKMASVVLQLEKATQISSIDIGNEHSAYVEVLVTRSGTSDDFKVLLVMSSFMSPLDSRQSQNINKVRMFKQDDLSQDVCQEKWDRVKIICTQPFNRHVQYGLSFINLHTNNGTNSIAPTQTNIGKFTIRPDSPDNHLFGSLFARRKEILNVESPKAAVAIRDASSAACSDKTFSPKPKTQVLTPKPKTTCFDIGNSAKKPRNRDELLYDKDDEANEKIKKRFEQRDNEKLRVQEMQEKNKVSKDRNATTVKLIESKKENKSDDNRETNKKRKKLDSSTSSGSSGNISKKVKQDVTKKVFSKLLEGVVLVISGIQNPDRANLRTLALSMGARYKPDWDNESTHLICAFVNTPKFNQVKGKGKIVTRKWIEDCHSLRKRLPWRRYALDRNDKGDESEEEIWEKLDSPVASNNEDDCSDMDQELGSDTDERVAKILEKDKQSKSESTDIFDLDTASENTDDESNSNVGLQEFTNKFRNIFDDITFFLDDAFNVELHHKLRRYIMAYGGLLADDPTKNIDIFVTKKNANIFKEINPNVKCVLPDWIWECHNTKDSVSYDDYLL